jgi:YcaO-like protein with predicted kinase domain
MTQRAVAEKRHVDGTHRTVEPAATLERLHAILRRIGITRVAVITGLDVVGIPVVTVCRPNARSLSVSQGKGVDLVAAKVSGIMEAVEAWHAENVLLPLRLATYRELRAVAEVVDVEQLPRPSSSRFHPDLTILWIEGTDVFSAAKVWVPYESVHLDFRAPGPQGTGCFLATSTGLAAGNHLLEAVSHALCEVVERDAVALWSERAESDRASRQVDLNTVTDRGCRQLLDAYESARVGVGVWDLTTDLGLPVFLATIAGRSAESVGRLPAAMGYGCHPDRAVALSRALTEAAQSRLTLIAGTRDDFPPGYYRQGREAKAIATHVARLNRRPARAFTDAAHASRASIDEDVAHELDCLRAAGVQQAILVELTRSDVRIPVVRTVVPGLEGWVDKVEGNVPGERRRALREPR